MFHENQIKIHSELKIFMRAARSHKKVERNSVHEYDHFSTSVFVITAKFSRC